MSGKVALVIGNKDYECEKLKGLFYPETDAFDVALALSSLGFKVRAQKKSTSFPGSLAEARGCKRNQPRSQGLSLKREGAKEINLVPRVSR